MRQIKLASRLPFERKYKSIGRILRITDFRITGRVRPLTCSLHSQLSKKCTYPLPVSRKHSYLSILQFFSDWLPYTSGFIGLLSCSCLHDGSLHKATCVVCVVVDWTADVRRRADVVDVIKHWPIRHLLRWRQRLIDLTRCSENHDNRTRVLRDRLVLRNQSTSSMLSLARLSASIASNDLYSPSARLVVLSFVIYDVRCPANYELHSHSSEGLASGRIGPCMYLDIWGSKPRQGQENIYSNKAAKTP